MRKLTWHLHFCLFFFCFFFLLTFISKIQHLEKYLLLFANNTLTSIASDLHTRGGGGYPWMDAYMAGWMHGCVVCGWVDAWADEWMVVWADV